MRSIEQAKFCPDPLLVIKIQTFPLSHINYDLLCRYADISIANCHSSPSSFYNPDFHLHFPGSCLSGSTLRTGMQFLGIELLNNKT